MTVQFGLAPEDVSLTETVPAEHGNASSVTVLFVFDEIVRRQGPRAGAPGLLGAFGPGLGAELAWLERC
jgi:predicted naringenin-chalcone synthase